MQTIVFHRGGFCFAFIPGRFESLRIHTRIHLHRQNGGDRVLRQIRTMLCADFVHHREHTLRIRIAVWQSIRLHQFRDHGVFVVACTSLQTGHGRPECVDAIVHGRKIGICGDAYSTNSSLRASYSSAGTSTLTYIIIMHAHYCSGIAALSDGSSLSSQHRAMLWRRFYDDREI